MNISQEIKTLVDQSNSIVITAHKSPDGDSIGSSLALHHFLESIGKKSTVVHPDEAPDYLQWVPGQSNICVFEKDKELATKFLTEADLIFCLDYNSPKRVGEEMQAILEGSPAKKVMIDHHLHPVDFCDVMISDAVACSTAQLIFEWIENINALDLISPTTGSCIYLGIMTDTGSFRFPSVSSKTHRICAKLLELGVEHFKIHESIYDTNTIDRIRLKGFALSEKLICIPGIPVAYASLSEEEMNRFNYQNGDTEGIVNQVLGIQGIQMAAFFAEKEGKVKISFRSKGDYFVNELSSTHFEGGGHAYASGGISSDSLEETINRFVTNVNKFIPQ